MIFELSSDQVSEIKQSMRRSDAIQLAKQYFKAQEAFEELQRRLASCNRTAKVDGPKPLTQTVRSNSRLAWVRRFKVVVLALVMLSLIFTVVYIYARPELVIYGLFNGVL